VIGKSGEFMGIDAVIIAGLAFGGAVTAIVFFLGLASGPSSTLISSPSASGANASCATLCTTWNAWRTAACTAIAASTAAAAALAAANAALASAATTAALLLAAAVATSLIPFFGSAIAASLFAAYVVAQVVVVFLLGRQVAASQTAGAAASEVTIKLAGVSSALAELMTSCTDPPTLAACLATPSPCSGVP
jgi:hypothetical protein